MKRNSKIVKTVALLLTIILSIGQGNPAVKASTSTYLMTDSDTSTKSSTKGVYSHKTRVDITNPPTLVWKVKSHDSYVKLSYSKKNSGLTHSVSNNSVKATIRAVGFTSLSDSGFEFGSSSTKKTLKSSTDDLDYTMYGVAYGGLYNYSETGEVKYVLRNSKKDKVATVVLSTYNEYGI